MIETVFENQDLPAGERFECWRDMACESHSPHDIRTEHTADFPATMRLLRLGPLQLSAYGCPPVQAVRSRKHIARSDPEVVHLSCVVRGRMVLSDGAQEAVGAPGGLLLFSSSRPYQGHREAASGAVKAVDLVIPHSLLPLHGGFAGRCLPRRLHGSPEVGRLLVQLITHLSTSATDYGPEEGTRLGAAALDLAAVLVAESSGSSAGVPPEVRESVLLKRARSFILRNLGDLELDPSTVAAAHHVSLRSLQRLFQQQGTTVAAFIRGQRLEHARRELEDPRLSTQPIRAVAARWGYLRPGDFTRAFCAAYGLPPRDYRALSLGDQAGAPR
ncbi:helix-turn-helix domain-containing protein [Streptomyces sp. NPDC052179]|uniref:AraC-like ligand-binding domain-containing protein n=1 Tax=Streptomyces sp. NPDC052179 TaxID=3155680 RepID=UPI0034273C44